MTEIGMKRWIVRRTWTFYEDFAVFGADPQDAAARVAKGFGSAAGASKPKLAKTEVRLAGKDPSRKIVTAGEIASNPDLKRTRDVG